MFRNIWRSKAKKNSAEVVAPPDPHGSPLTHLDLGPPALRTQCMGRKQLKLHFRHERDKEKDRMRQEHLMEQLRQIDAKDEYERGLKAQKAEHKHAARLMAEERQRALAAEKVEHQRVTRLKGEERERVKETERREVQEHKNYLLHLKRTRAAEKAKHKLEQARRAYETKSVKSWQAVQRARQHQSATGNNWRRKEELEEAAHAPQLAEACGVPLAAAATAATAAPLAPRSQAVLEARIEELMQENEKVLARCHKLEDARATVAVAAGAHVGKLLAHIEDRNLKVTALNEEVGKFKASNRDAWVKVESFQQAFETLTKKYVALKKNAQWPTTMMTHKAFRHVLFKAVQAGELKLPDIGRVVMAPCGRLVAEEEPTKEVKALLKLFGGPEKIQELGGGGGKK